MGSRDGLIVLVVEDDPFIAFDLEDLLRALGCEPAVVQDNQAAAEWLDRHRPDRAILDFKLARDTSLSTAERLAGLGIPIAFATGYGDHVPLPDGLNASTIFNKPVNRDAVAAWLDSAD
jgi:DNA-binding response OmpR family regulator